MPTKKVKIKRTKLVRDAFRISREISFVPLLKLLKKEGDLKDGLEIFAGEKLMIFLTILGGS